MDRIRPEIPQAQTDFGQRWLVMMTANAMHELTDDELRTISLNVAAHQRDSHVLRRDRYVPKPNITRQAATRKGSSMNNQEFKTREAALIMNQSDAAILDEMEELEREVGLDMSPKEQAWYDYIYGGGDKPE